MTEPAACVYIDLGGVSRSVGRLWVRRDRNRESASFEFDRDWLADPVAVQVSAALQTWRSVAAECGVTRDEIERMASAFEHDEAVIVRSWH